VVADIGRAAGPPLELIAEATLVVVVARPVAAQLVAAAAHAAFVEGLVAGRSPVCVCVAGVRLRDEGVLRLATAAHGLRVAARLPFSSDRAAARSRADGALVALLEAAA
jgi:hypothetical protein